MKEIEYIIGVYHYLNSQPELATEPAYYLLYLLDDKGILDNESALKLYRERFKSEMHAPEFESDFNKNKIGPFDSVAKLNQFAFALCEELNAARVTLYSVEEYNAILENAQGASDFHRDLIEKGNVMENIDRKKKGLFSRLFS